MMGSVLDISDRKQAEEALRASEERFRRLSEAAEEGIAIHDRGVIIEANEALTRMFGYELPELIGKIAGKLADPESWKIIIERMAAGREEPKKAEARVVAFGDADFVSNDALGFQGNENLFLNVMAWLSGESDLISIRRRDPEEHRLSVISGSASHRLVVLGSATSGGRPRRC